MKCHASQQAIKTAQRYQRLTLSISRLFESSSTSLGEAHLGYPGNGLPENVKFLYASEELDYETLKNVKRVLQTHGTTCCKQYRYSLRALAFDPILTFQEQVEPMISIRETWTQHTSITLYHLRRLFSAFQATDKRDLFYALLGLVTDWGSSTPLYPSYTTSKREAIAQAVFKCVSEQGGIGFLLGERFFRDDEEEKMPS